MGNSIQCQCKKWIQLDGFSGWVGGEGAAWLDADDTISDEALGIECVRLLKQFTGLTNISDPCKTFRYVIH